MVAEGFTVEALRDYRGEALVRDYKAQDEEIAGVSCERVIVGDSPADTTILYLHGGGYLRGNASEFRGATVPLAHATGADVVVPNYRLAPENPFPAAFDDCVAVYGQLIAEAASKGTRLVIAGDSGGAALATSVMARARETGLPMARCAVLNCPYADMLGASASLDDPRYSSPTLTRARIDWLRQTYLAAGNPDPRDPRHSPVYADLKGLPPLLVQVGGRDPFHDDGTRLAARAEECGVDVELTEYSTSGHVWVVKGTNPADPEAARAVTQAAEFIAEHTKARAL